MYLSKKYPEHKICVFLKFIKRARLNTLVGRFWPACLMFEGPVSTNAPEGTGRGPRSDIKKLWHQKSASLRPCPACESQQFGGLRRRYQILLPKLTIRTHVNQLSPQRQLTCAIFPLSSFFFIPPSPCPMCCHPLCVLVSNHLSQPFYFYIRFSSITPH